MRGRRSAILALLGVVIMALAPSAAAADGIQVKLALRPIDQPGPYYDLTMRPGETRSLEVEIANYGDAAIAARTYAADVYTIVNGGFGGDLRDEPTDGATRWLDYPSDVVELPAGTRTTRVFTVDVPAQARPGEYIASLILENDVPIRSPGDVALDQFARQALAVVVTVPGERIPALAIGEAKHADVGGTSVVSVAVENAGNVRLKPVSDFTLRDAAGAVINTAQVAMDTFYARTATFIEVTLDARLQAGTYYVDLTLEDSTQAARAAATDIVLVVGERPVGAPAGSNDPPGLSQVFQGLADGSIPLVVLVIGILASFGLGGIVVGLLMFAVRRHGPTRPAPRKRINHDRRGRAP